MKVTELESKGLKKSLRIIIEGAQINAQVEAELRAAGANVKIPGFRPGFVPMKVLQQRYGKSVQGDVLKQLINRSSSDALAQKNLRPALTPQVNIEDYKDGGDLTYSMAFEVLPEVPEIGFDKITLERSTFEIGEKDIDEAMERVASNSPEFKRCPEGTKAQLGQIVSIDFKGMINGKAFDGGSASDFNLELGSKQFISGFEEQLVGAKEGDDRIVTVTFPADYPADNLAGKEASFAVKIKGIHDKGTPEMNEEFAKARGFADLNALREAVRGQLTKEYDQAVRNQLKKQLFDAMEDKYDFELPQSMVDLEFNTIWERLKQAQAQDDESVAGKSDEELKTEYQQIARRRVKLGLVLAEIGMREKIQISREELSQAMMQQASMYPGQEKKLMEFYRKNPDRLQDLRGPILEEKAVDFILAKVKFNDKKASLKDLLASVDADDEDAPKKAAKSKPEKKEAKKETAKPKTKKK